MRTFCGARGAREFRVVPTAATVVVGVATLGIYTPREVRVECR
jgi:hypothetical protein